MNECDRDRTLANRGRDAFYAHNGHLFVVAQLRFDGRRPKVVDGVGGQSAAPADHSTIGILAQAVARLEAAPFPYRPSQ